MIITREIERLIFQIELMDDIYDEGSIESFYLTLSELTNLKKLMDDNPYFFEDRYDDAQYLYKIISDGME